MLISLKCSTCGSALKRNMGRGRERVERAEGAWSYMFHVCFLNLCNDAFISLLTHLSLHYFYTLAYNQELTVLLATLRLICEPTGCSAVVYVRNQNQQALSYCRLDQGDTN